MFQPREQVKSPETNLNETDKSHLSHREFKIMLRRMLIEVRKAMHEQRKIFQQRLTILKSIKLCTNDLCTLFHEYYTSVRASWVALVVKNLLPPAYPPCQHPEG